MKRVRWLVAIAGLLGCSSGDPSVYDRSRLAVCESVCRGYQRCRLTDALCEARCASIYEPQGIRPSALFHVASCLEQLDCAVLASESAFEKCTIEAGAAEPLRDAVLEYCESAAQSLFQCDRWLPVQECTAAVGVWSDERLADAQVCYAEACDAIDDCQHLVFGAAE